MSSTAPIFVCTPELVGSWLFYPAWFCTPGFMPRQIVMDYRDFETCRREGVAPTANPYDYMVWETLRGYAAHNFLAVRDPEWEANMGTANPTKFSYSYYVPEKARRDLRIRARRIISKLSKDELLQIARAGFANWQRFGLELKKRFKARDPVFGEAIARTQREILQIEAGQMPVDPEKLLHRYLMKLMVGLKAADAYARRCKIPDSHTRVFDTPEYLPAARLLVKHENISFDRFAIPTKGPEENENKILSMLKIDKPISPLCQQDFLLLLKAVEAARELLLAEGDVIAKATILHECEEARKRCRKKGLMNIAKGAIAVPAIATAIAENPEMAPQLAALLALVLYSIEGEAQMRDALGSLSPVAQFVTAREKFYGWAPLFKVRDSCVRAVLRMARTIHDRPRTEERIARQMMGPWLDHDVWYA